MFIFGFSKDCNKSKAPQFASVMALFKTEGREVRKNGERSESPNIL